jgi:hypothetical protein
VGWRARLSDLTRSNPKPLVLIGIPISLRFRPDFSGIKILKDNVQTCLFDSRCTINTLIFESFVAIRDAFDNKIL